MTATPQLSLPEVPLLGVLPGTGGLTRLVDKRKVRRDLADVFSHAGRRHQGKARGGVALGGRCVPARPLCGSGPRTRAGAGAEEPPREGPGIVLDALSPEATADAVRYRHVELKLDHQSRNGRTDRRWSARRAAGDTGRHPARPAADFWPLPRVPEIDDALLRLRFHYDKIGLVALKTARDLAAVRQIDTVLYRLREDWLVNEILLLMARTLRAPRSYGSQPVRGGGGRLLLRGQPA